ncbi:trypsin-like peptidase domain-containing protein [Streptomyces sp. NPDC046805]|uniref:VMAP-C domain-containing protein n=1 Tax=Streptomyces sp. NPDC046805 TaxID=3155134 RepID=UPI003406F043
MSAFDEMVRPSLARIGVPGDGYATDRDAYWGSGFFIAPGWLLTCAHVVGKGGAAVCRGENAVDVAWESRTPAGAWEERTGAGTVVLVKPRPEAPESVRDPWPWPDIALVKVRDSLDVRCLWLSDRTPSTPAPVSVHGWFQWAGELGIRNRDGEAVGSHANRLLLSSGLPVEGLSGGPVIDQRYGAVIGVIKGRGRDEGAAVPITALHELLELRDGGKILREVLRAHDLHHLSLLDEPSPSPYPNWTTAQAGLPGYTASGIAPELRARLYGHLAHLPLPTGRGEVVHLVEEVKRQVRGDEHPSLILQEARTWREGAGLLHGLRALDQGGGGKLVDLDAVLLYAAKVVRHVVRAQPEEVDRESLGAFTGWIAEQAERHEHWAVGEAIRALLDGLDGPSSSLAPAAPAPSSAAGTASPARTDVLVKVGAPMYGELHPWSVQLLHDGRDVTPVDGDDHGVRVDKLSETLREPLAKALSQGDHGEHLAAIEVFLPRQLFDLPVDDWQLTPGDAEDDDFMDERSMPLGLRRTVVVRDVLRNGREPSPEWVRRWKGVARGPLAPESLHGRPPADGHPPGARPQGRYAFYGSLSGMADACVPVYCGPVGGGEGRQAMRDALRAGHPLVLWRRDHHDHDACRGFHQQAVRLLGLAGSAGGLHGPVRDLRIRLADPAAARDQGLQGKIAVLFDPPDRPPYGTEAVRPPPLAAPGG